MELVTYEFLTRAQVQRTEYAHGEQTITPLERRFAEAEPEKIKT